MINMNSSSKYNMHLTFCFLCFMSFYVFPLSGQNSSIRTISMMDVGLILDSNNFVGQMSKTCMTMAIEEFYATHSNYTTRIVLHYRDSKDDVVEAASAAVDLLKNVQVQAILGPQRSKQAEFVINVGNKVKVPIISQATSPALSSVERSYFVRAARKGTSQSEALASIFKAFNWREVVLIYEESYHGSSMVPHVADELLKADVHVKDRIGISVSDTDDHILQELYKLMTMQTRVFVVHMLPTLASRFFLKVKKAEMMSKGYAWIITDGLTSLLDFLDPIVISSMQGVLGLRPFVTNSKQLDIFNKRWRKIFREENPDVDRFEVNTFGLWAYDSIQALAMAVERAGISKKPFQKPVNYGNLTDLAAIGTSEMGAKLLESIRNIRFEGLSGDFRIIDGELQSSDFQIVNVIGKGDRMIGFWSRDYGISKDLKTIKKNYTSNKEDLGTIIWPGESNEEPRGWDFPTNEKKLRVGVPVKSFGEFMKVERDPQKNTVKATGFSIDVFKELLNQPTWSYAVPYDLIPFQRPDGQPAGDYNDLVYEIYLGKFDAVVGDITILANRSSYVDFTLPYTESGFVMLVPIKGEDAKNAWIFMKPLSMDLWLTTGAFFIFTGFVVWVLEHGVNKEFRGSPHEQIGTILWFSFSTMVFAQKENVIGNLSRFVLIIWMFLLLVLTSSYTANLTSMLTVQKLQPTVTEINNLIRNREYVGVQDGSFVYAFLVKMGFDKSNIRNYSTLDEYHEALTKGSKDGGVSAVVDEIPYLRRLLTKYCTNYTTVGPTYKTAGLGFAFTKGSPLVPDMSRAILHLKEDKMAKIEKEWFGDEKANCAEQTENKTTSDRLTLDSFKGLFLIAGISSLSSLIVFLTVFLYNNREIISSDKSFKQKLTAIAKNFDQHKEYTKDASKEVILPAYQIVPPENTAPKDDSPESPAVCISNREEQIFTSEEGSSMSELGIAVHETDIVGTEGREAH